ncbi:lytic transglycosylase domain-containing protein [Geobacter pelophilus]|uniref:Lytic transglycosylase domain-containing protein n=1 Tax=Geoanaerobacter pelophilus TaxID=60036 RepID=A0AAW4L746_9BACT|nr:lytic transglycosylase domain-containing protein [Geoanaerobacter pelophilus]MBT0663071.1 lytic transglycosylase domain-containing protein [Geoanaerobacter pelophilus]
MHFAILILLLGVNAFSTEAAFGFCYEEAGNRYGISPHLLYAISKGESNFNPFAVNHNANGSYDYGLMQINSSWEPALRKLGIPWNTLADPCTNVMVGSWVLSQCIRDYGYTWLAVGCYNSRTPSKRDRYAARIASIVIQEQAHLRVEQIASITNVSKMTPWEEAFGNSSR